MDNRRRMMLATLGGGIPLSDLPEGSILKIAEKGVLKDFYVAKHNYESGLNGAGKTLVVRKDCYDKRRWHSSNVNAYATSDIDAWLNGDYKALLSSKVQKAIKTTKFYYTPGNGNKVVSTLERAVFLLSASEFGKTSAYYNEEGTVLPIASKLNIGYLNGVAVEQLTRTPYKNSTTQAEYVQTSGDIAGSYCTRVCGSRPIFTLPKNAPCELNADGSYTLLM